MSDLQHIILPAKGGLNSDDAYEFMPAGDGVARRNIFVPPDNNGRVENMLGNSHIVSGIENFAQLLDNPDFTTWTDFKTPGSWTTNADDDYVLNDLFTAWTGEDPDNWTVYESVGSIAPGDGDEVRFYKTVDGNLSISQSTSLLQGQAYGIVVKVNNVSAGSLRVAFEEDTEALEEVITTVGTHVFWFTPNVANPTITLAANYTGAADFTVGACIIFTRATIQDPSGHIRMLAVDGEQAYVMQSKMTVGNYYKLVINKTDVSDGYLFISTTNFGGTVADNTLSSGVNTFYRTAQGITVAIYSNTAGITDITLDYVYLWDVSALEGIKTIGYVEDTENNLLYILILGDHGVSADPRYTNSIVEFNPATETFTKVLWEESALQFDPDYYIKDAQVVDGWIYYNGYSYGLKKVNIALAKNYTAYSLWVSGSAYSANDIVRRPDGRMWQANTSTSGTVVPESSDDWTLYDYCYPVGEENVLESVVFDYMNIAPSSAATTSYGTDEDVLSNNVRGKLFQFTYRYKYRYHGYSRTAPVSDVTRPVGEETVFGEIVNDITFNNYIQVSFGAGNIGMIESVELYVREGNSGLWKYIDTVPSTTTSYNFYNNKILAEADQTEIDTIADAVPHEVKCMEFISENVMLVAETTEGRDNIDLDVTLTADAEKVGSSVGGPSQTFDASFGYQETYWWYFFNATGLTTGVGDYVKIFLRDRYYNYIFDSGYVALTSADTATATAFCEKCESIINGGTTSFVAVAGPDTLETSGSVSAGYLAVRHSSLGNVAIVGTISVYVANSSTPYKYGGFKTGAQHPLGIVYFDESLRPSGVMKDDDCVVYVPTIPEAYNNGMPGVTMTDQYEWRTIVHWAVSHTPPSWAHYWQWFYAGNETIEASWTYITDGISATSETPTPHHTKIDITTLQAHQTTYPASQLGPYTWNAGDRVRILTAAAASGDYGSLLSTIVDLEIEKYDETTKELYVAYDSGNYGGGTHSLIEIYRPKTVKGETYYAFGPMMRIYESGGNRYHRGQTQDQTAYDGSGDATGTFDYGDVYFIGRSFATTLTGGTANMLYLVESQSYSDFYDSASYNLGKLNTPSDIGEVTLHNIRFSNRYLQDTSINGLCTFDALDYKPLPEKNGVIWGMRQIGGTLKVYQANRPVSVWIGKTETYDTEGSYALSSSYQILGSIREQEVDIGCITPSSIAQNERHVYGFDLRRGIFWRDSANGIFPISGKVATMEGFYDYKMVTWFRNLAEAWTSDLSSKKMITEWDDYTKCLWVTVKSSDDTHEYTLAFSEPANRWVAFYDIADYNGYGPDIYMRWKNRFYSFRTAELYEHNDLSANRAEFYGKDWSDSIYVDFAVNNEPAIPKLFNSIEVHTNGEWYVVEATIPEDVSYRNGMYSMIPVSLFERRSGVWRAPFLRNMKTRSATATSVDLYQGEQLRGRAMYVKMQLSSTATAQDSRKTEEVYVTLIRVDSSIVRY